MIRPSRSRVLRPWLAFVFVALVPTFAQAAAARHGGTFDISGAVGIGSKSTDIAYDPVNDVYLMVSGPEAFGGGVVYGRFVHGDGTPLGQGVFRIPASTAFTQFPRVAYSQALGGFLVAWIDGRANPEFGQVWGRFLRVSPGGQPAFATGDFLIGGAFVQANRPPAVACGGAKPECLVAWGQMVGGPGGADDIHAARLDLSGTRLGNEIAVTHDLHWQTLPAAAYDPATGVYLVGYNMWTHTGSVWIQRIQGETGAVLGTDIVKEGGDLSNPTFAYDSRAGQFLITYYDERGLKTYGRFVKSDGTFTSNNIPLVSGYTASDANGVAYNAVSGTFFAVTHGKGLEDVGYEISAVGLPSDEFQVTVSGPGGNFYPRIAAHGTRAEWLITTSKSFRFVAGQRITTDTQGPGNPPPPPPPPPENETIDLTPAAAPFGSWFFAEGLAQSGPNGFATFYLVANEHPFPVNVRAYFSDADGRTIKRNFTVAANSRATLELATVAGLGTFGAVFQSEGGGDIVVERSVYWGVNWEGSTGEIATKSLSQTWYFGEGSRELFSNYFLVFNPTQAAAQLTFEFYPENGQTVSRTLAIGPQQRVTLDALDVAELAHTSFGVRITSTTPVIAERAMYFGRAADGGWIGGTASVGAPGLSNRWLFAEGAAAAGFDTFYLLMNPNAFPIDVTRSYFREGHERHDVVYTIPASSRKTIYLNDEMGPIGSVSAEFASEHGFVAERSIYWGANGWVEGTNVVGSPATSASWFVPEGTEGPTWDAYLLIGNPQATATTLDIVLFVEGRGRFAAPAHLRPVVGPNARLTITMADFLRDMEIAGGLTPGTLTSSSFSTSITARDGGSVIVEHALYNRFDDANRWRAGSASFGVRR